MKSNHSYIKFSGEYFFMYFALGSFLPLLSIYFESIGLTGTQIGFITSTGSFVTIFAPPFWGIVSDKSMKHKTVLASLMAVCMVMFLLVPTTSVFTFILIIFVIFNIGSSALNPLMDGLTLHSPISFGKIRQWGAIGYATAAFLIAKLAAATDLSLIFYVYVISMGIAMAFLLSIKIDLSHHDSLHLRDVKTLLKNKTFLVFLLYVLLIAGTLGGHNVFFSLLFQEVGGSPDMVGFAFLLFAAVEAPFMLMMPFFIKKYGILSLMLAAPLLGAVRWALHAVLPSPWMHLAIFFLQGIFYAPFLIGVAEYVRSRIAQHLTTTAITVYSAIGFGIGGIIANMTSGLLYDHINAKAIYLFYTALCIASFLVVLVLVRLDRKSSGHIL